MIPLNSFTQQAQVTIDGVSFLLPRSEIVHIALIENIRASDDEGKAVCGVIDFDDLEWPVYSLSGELLPSGVTPDKRRFVICLNSKDRYLALPCDGVQNKELTENAIIEELFDVMTVGSNPIRLLVYTDGDMSFVTNAEAIMTFIYSTDNR